VVEQPVEDDRGQHLVAGDHLRPLTDRLVRGEDRRGPLVARREDLEEQVGVAAVESLEAELVNDEHRGGPVAPALHPAQAGGIVPPQLVEQLVGRHRRHRKAVGHRLDPEPKGEVGLADARRSEQQDVLPPPRELAGGQQLDLAAVDPTGKGEVEGLEGFHRGQPGELQGGLHPPLLAGVALGGQHEVEEAGQRRLLPHPALDQLGEDVDGELEADVGEQPAGAIEVALGAHASLRTSSRTSSIGRRATSQLRSSTIA